MLILEVFIHINKQELDCCLNKVSGHIGVQYLVASLGYQLYMGTHSRRPRSPEHENIQCMTPLPCLLHQRLEDSKASNVRAAYSLRPHPLCFCSV